MNPPSPRPLGDARRHYWRALRMAQATGVDLQHAMDAGVITSGDWAGSVDRCRGCGWDKGCGAWLATQKTGAADLPQACPNAALFARAAAAVNAP